jgi:hypothetical protein
MAFIVGAEIYDHLEKVVDRLRTSPTRPLLLIEHLRRMNFSSPGVLLIALIAVALLFD